MSWYVAKQILILNVLETAEYYIYMDAKNVQLPGLMWGFHTDGVKQLIFTHIEGLLNVLSSFLLLQQKYDKYIFKEFFKLIFKLFTQVFIRGKDTNNEHSFNNRSDV